MAGIVVRLREINDLPYGIVRGYGLRLRLGAVVRLGRSMIFPTDQGGYDGWQGMWFTPSMIFAKRKERLPFYRQPLLLELIQLLL